MYISLIKQRLACGAYARQSQHIKSGVILDVIVGTIRHGYLHEYVAKPSYINWGPKNIPDLENRLHEA